MLPMGFLVTSRLVCQTGRLLLVGAALALIAETLALALA